MIDGVHSSELTVRYPFHSIGIHTIGTAERAGECGLQHATRKIGGGARGVGEELPRD